MDHVTHGHKYCGFCLFTSMFASHVYDCVVCARIFFVFNVVGNSFPPARFGCFFSGHFFLSLSLPPLLSKNAIKIEKLNSKIKSDSKNEAVNLRQQMRKKKITIKILRLPKSENKTKNPKTTLKVFVSTLNTCCTCARHRNVKKYISYWIFHDFIVLYVVLYIIVLCCALLFCILYTLHFCIAQIRTRVHTFGKAQSKYTYAAILLTVSIYTCT